MNTVNSAQVPRFDRMIRGIVQWNSILAAALLIVGYLLTRSSGLALGVLVGAILATFNAIMLARKLKTITALADPKMGQVSMMAGMLVRFLFMGAGMAAFVFLARPDLLGMGGMVGAILLFQVITGWQASRSMMPSSNVT